MTLKPWIVSNEEIRNSLKHMDVSSIDSEFYNRFGKWVVKIGKTFLIRQLELDYVNPKTETLLTTTAEYQLLMQIVDGLEYSINEDSVVIRISKKCDIKSITLLEYGSTTRLPYPFYRKMIIYLTQNFKELVALFYYEEGVDLLNG